MLLNTQIINFMKEIFTNDNELKAYVMKEFNKELVLLVGIDVNASVERELIPAIVIEPLTKQVGEKNKDFIFTLLIRILIKGNEMPKQTRLKDIILNEYTGIYQVEKIGEFLINGIKNRLCETNVENESIEFYHDEIDSFPMCSGAVVFEFSLPNLIGEEEIKFIRKD